MLKSLGTCIDWAAGGYAPRTNDELRHALLAPWTEVEGQKPSDDRVAGEDPRPAARTFTALCSKKATILNKVPVRRCQSTQWHTSADPMPGKRMTASHRPEPIRVAAVKWPERGMSASLARHWGTAQSRRMRTFARPPWDHGDRPGAGVRRPRRVCVRLGRARRWRRR